MTLTFLRLRILHLPVKHSGCFLGIPSSVFSTLSEMQMLLWLCWVKFESDFPDLACMHALINKGIF